MRNRKLTPAGSAALGGVMAALTVAVMGLGGMIPIATYVCPVFAMMILQIILKICGKKTAWAWYGTVAILCLLISPDKEAAFFFLFLGYYPILKPWFDSKKWNVFLKLFYFNAVIILLYWLLLSVIGMTSLREEFAVIGRFMEIILLVLGNVTFLLLDFVLGRRPCRRKQR